MPDDQERRLSSEEMIRLARERRSSQPDDASMDPAPDTDVPDSDDTSYPQTAGPPSGSRGFPAETAIEKSEGSPTVGSMPTFGKDDRRRMRETAPQIPQQPVRRSWLRRLPIGWLIFGLIFASGSIVSFFTSADRDESGTVVGAGDVSSADLQVGDCLLFPDEMAADGSFEFESLKAVPCSEPHDLEIFANIEYRDPTDFFYPGEDRLLEYADENCDALFTNYVGLPVEAEARLVYTATYPTSQSWDAGDRVLNCYLVTWDGSTISASQKDGGLLGFGGLELGFCYDFHATETYVSFDEIPCSEPHLLEFYASEVLPLPHTSAYPGDEYVAEVVERVCGERFVAITSGLVGPQLEYLFVAPDAVTWESEVRQIQCHLVTVDGTTLVGSYTEDA